MTPNQLKRMMISRNAKGVDTKGEVQFNEYQISRKMELLHDISLDFYDIVAVKYFKFQMDFVRLVPATDFEPGRYDLDIEIDGKGHNSKKDPWKDKLKNADGMKVVHIPEAITHQKYWEYLDYKLELALRSKEQIVHIAA